MGQVEINAFLTQRAVGEGAGGSPEKQALCALFFICHQVLKGALSGGLRVEAARALRRPNARGGGGAPPGDFQEQRVRASLRFGT